MKTIYKKDTSGKIRYLKTWTEGDVLHQVTGVVGTENPVPHQKVCTPKNVGRANATTGAEQAISEMESLIAEKVKGGYFDSVENAEDGEVILPMLAKSYGDEAKKIDWSKPVYVQPKLDGMRALGDKSLISRKGTVIDTVPHLSFIKDLPLHLDGELYAHGKSFQENMRLTKKYRPGESEAVKYHVYDCIAEGDFAWRYLALEKLIGDYAHIHKGFVELVPTIKVFNEAQLKRAHAININDGYEGSIVRHGTAPYKVNGRSSNLLKYKDFLDLACEIVDIEPADSRPTWGVPVLTYKGKTFRAGMKYSHAERENFLANKQKFIGKIAEIRFFEYSEDGIPRFPVMVGVRLDKVKGD